MTLLEYYQILDLQVGSSVEEIKKAYRKKARIYHPDINTSANAKDLFITVTEAYEFLMTNHEKLRTEDESFHQAMEDWRKYRQNRSHKRATVFAGRPFNTFKNSSFYKTTRIFDGTTIIISFIISILALVVAISGYFYRLRNPIPGLEEPSVFALIVLLLPGIIFFIISFIYLRVYQDNFKKHQKKA
jgi:hypothetical protein